MRLRDGLVYFYFGGWSCFNFMETAYVYPEIPRWFYATDAGFAAINLLTAVIVVRLLSKVSA